MHRGGASPKTLQRFGIDPASPAALLPYKSVLPIKVQSFLPKYFYGVKRAISPTIAPQDPDLK
jgi:hypothetical protein